MRSGYLNLAFLGARENVKKTEHFEHKNMG